MPTVYFAQEAPLPDWDPVHTDAPVNIGPGRTRNLRTRFVLSSLGGPFGPGLIKIGYTARLPRSRLASLAGRLRRVITVVGLMSGPCSVERTLHNRFGHLRAPTPADWGREWFRPEHELLEFIETLPAHWDPVVARRLHHLCDRNGAWASAPGASESSEPSAAESHSKSGT